MSLVFAGVCSHGPGITARSEQADPGARQRLLESYARLRAALHASRPDVLVVVAAEHFANFFMNNMPAFAVGMADHYHGPIEDADWLRIPPRKVAGSPAIARELIKRMSQEVDLSYCEEWQFDHGVMVPLHLLDPDNLLPVIPININCQAPPLPPLARSYAVGQALRRAADDSQARVALIGTGGISHWPCTPDSGRINEAWDRDFLERWRRLDRDALLSYTDEDTYRDAGQGGFEIRTFIAVAGAAEAGKAEIWCYEPIPIYACGCTIGHVELPA